MTFDRKINGKKCRQNCCKIKQHHQCWLRNSNQFRFFFFIMKKNLYTKACNRENSNFTNGVEQPRPRMTEVTVLGILVNSER